jgi:hypothetical protein
VNLTAVSLEEKENDDQDHNQYEDPEDQEDEDEKDPDAGYYERASIRDTKK